MDTSFNVWFCNPHILVQNKLFNPEFDNKIHYTTLQEDDSEGNHQFKNFMSGNWAWKQVVSQNYPYTQYC